MGTVRGLVGSVVGLFAHVASRSGCADNHAQSGLEEDLYLLGLSREKESNPHIPPILSIPLFPTENWQIYGSS